MTTLVKTKIRIKMNVIDYKYNLQINNVKPARNDTK
jgi:hypothetical protein